MGRVQEVHFDMYPESAFRKRGKSMILRKKDQSAPDYTPMANASAESARIAGELGQQQLDFAKQQYADSKPYFEQLVDQQMEIADKSAAQGDDYYNYMKSYRPAEQAMLNEAMTDRSAEISAYDAANQADAATMAMDPTQLYNQRRAEIEPLVAQAIADSQGGYTRSLNQAMRQGMRYGGSYNEIVNNAGSLGIAQAQQTAAMANAARTAGIEGTRSRAAMGLQTRQANMGALNKERAIDWAKKLDATGLVKGMPGASTGAYGLAVSAGNAAGQNQALPGQQMQAGLAAGANTTLQGRQLYQSGLGSILNAQGQYAGQAMNAQGEMGGAAIGAVGTIAAVAI